MIVLGEKRWLGLLFVVRGTPLERIWKRLLVVTVVAIAVTVAHHSYGLWTSSLTTTPFALIGLALGIFVGFRNNTSYDRFWEGRKLWGRLVNTSRSLARQTVTMVGPQPGQGTADMSSVHRELVYRIAAYVHAFRHHLRDEKDLADAVGFLSQEEAEVVMASSNPPVAILRFIGLRLRELWEEGLIHSHHFQLMEQTLAELTDIQGGCERIKSTPIPASYSVLIHRLVAFYVFALPFGLIDTVGQFTPEVTVLVAYAFLGLDAIGDEIEQPFGYERNDLPLSTISRMIEINLRECLGETELPGQLKPVAGVLQ